MSVLFYPESIRILGSDANGKNVMLCEMAVDDIANLPAANAFISDGYVLSMGCVATAINDNSKHRLNGSGNWIQIAAGTSTYTRAEIDALIANIDDELNVKITIQQAYGDAILIPSGSDLNSYNTPGLYYTIVANASTISNTPYNATGFRMVVEKNIPSGAAVFQKLIPTSRSHVDFYKRVFEGGNWSSWYKFTGTPV